MFGAPQRANADSQPRSCIECIEVGTPAQTVAALGQSGKAFSSIFEMSHAWSIPSCMLLLSSGLGAMKMRAS